MCMKYFPFPPTIGSERSSKRISGGGVELRRCFHQRYTLGADLVFIHCHPSELERTTANDSSLPFGANYSASSL